MLIVGCCSRHLHNVGIVYILVNRIIYVDKYIITNK